MKKVAVLGFLGILGILAIGIQISCSSDSSGGGPKGQGSTVYEYCVYKDEQLCSVGPFDKCESKGRLSDKCPAGYTEVNPPPPPSGGTLYEYCVNSKGEFCQQGSFDACNPGEQLSDDCPYESKITPPTPPSSNSNNGKNSSSSQNTSTPPTPGIDNSVFTYGALKACVVSGKGRICGSKAGYTNTAVQVRGVSWYWSNTDWGGEKFFTAAVVNSIVDDWKAQIVRAPLGIDGSDGGTYGSYVSDATNATLNKNRVTTVVDAAIAKGVYVIIDFHTHLGQTYKSQAKTFFEEMAEKYGGYDNVIFEIWNEPRIDGWTSIKNYANEIIPIIRQYSDNLIIVGTPDWSAEPNAASGNYLTDLNVAYVFHFYANEHKTSTHSSRLTTVLNDGKPIFVSEYGTTNADGNSGHNATETDAWHTFMDNNKISSCAWNLSDVSEGSAFFGTGTKLPATVTATDLTNTSKMTASGKYIYNKLRSYYTGVTDPGGGDEDYGTPCPSYCDWGTSGGGCKQIRTDPDGLHSGGTELATCARAEANCDYNGEGRYSSSNCVGSNLSIDNKPQSCSYSGYSSTYCQWVSGCHEIKTDPAGLYGENPVGSCDAALLGCKNATGYIYRDNGCYNAIY